MSQFRFTLDAGGSPLVLTQDPIDWDKAEIVVKRDAEIKGLFITYITKLTFFGAGYDRIFADSESTICQELTLLIEQQCQADEAFITFFSGIINLSEVEFNATRCHAKAVVENADLTAVIMRNFDLKVPMDNGSSIDGTVLADIGVDTDYFNEVTGAYTFTNKRTFRMRDAFQYLLDYVTNSQVTFVSDFFITDTNSIEAYTFVFDAALEAGNIITITWTNNWGQAIIAAPAFLNNNAQTLEQIARFIVVRSNALGSNPQAFELAWDQQMFSFASANETDTVTAETWLPFEDVTCVVTGGGSQAGCVVTKTSSMSYGMKNLVVCNGNALQDSVNPSLEQFISLRDLIVNCNQSFNTTFSIALDAAVPVFKVEREEDFFDLTSALVLPDVNNADYKFTKDFVRKSIQVGNVPNQPEIYRSWEGAQWDLANCIGDELDLVNEFAIDSKIIFFTASSFNDFNANKETLFFTQVEAAGAGAAQGFRWNWVIPAVPFPLLGLGTKNTYLEYNAHLIDGNKLFYHFFGVNGDMTSFNPNMTFALLKVLTNTSTIDIVKLYKFEAPITKTQFDTVTSDLTKSITFNVSPTDPNIVGWIKEMKYNVITGLTKFELYTRIS